MIHEKTKEAAQAASTPRVKLSGIKKRFGAIEALKGVDLDIHSGECLGLVGDNAAGKSTLSKILSGAYVPDAGTIEIDGELVSFVTPADARTRKIEMVYQDLSLCDTIDIPGNLFLGREPTRGGLLDRNRMRQEARQMLERLEIYIPDINALVEMLSG